jgi:hypothetical protein
MSASDRIPCLVVGCRRTAPRSRYPEDTSIICSKCYRLAPKRWRRLKSKIERRRRRDPDNVTLWRLERRVWERIVSAAQEARVGIG